MRVAFVWPGIQIPGWESLTWNRGCEATYANHGLAMISAVLKRAGHTCFLMDLRGFTSWEHFARILRQQTFDLLLVGCHSVDREHAIRVICEVKAICNVPIIVGGAHVSTTGEHQFPGATCTVIGEGDDVILGLVESVGKGEALPVTLSGLVVRDLDALPHLDRELFNLDYELASPLLPALPTPFVTTWFSRGCPYRCAFCTKRSLIFGAGQRCRSVGKVIEEFQLIRRGNIGNIGSIMVHDDMFPPWKWAEEFAEKFGSMIGWTPFWCQMRADYIADHPDTISHLRDVGLTWISLGVEAASQNMLNFLKKDLTVEQNYEAMEICNRLGVNVFANIILGLPGQTIYDYKCIEKFVSTTKPAHLSLSTYTAYPGSDIYEHCVKNQLFVKDAYYSMVRFPYEKKVEGVDYRYISQFAARMERLKGPVMSPGQKKRRVRPTRLPIKTGPKMTIITVSYERPEYLREAIMSVRTQTDPDWEHIIVEGGSANVAVQQLLKDLNDPRMSVIQHRINKNNISICWNEAIERASGRYVAFLDDDNRKKPQFIEKMCSFLEGHPEFSGVACFNELIDQKGDPTGSIHEGPKQFSLEGMLSRNYIDSGEIVFRREVFDQFGFFDERLATHDDWDFLKRVLHEGGSIGVLPEPLAEYRWHANNRVNNSVELGGKEHERIVWNKKHLPAIPIGVLSSGELTRSQQQICQGIIDGLKSISWVDFVFETTYQQNMTIPSKLMYLLVLAPFSIPHRVLEQLKVPLIFVCMEDPAAVQCNMERSRFASWIVTNDAAAVPLLSASMAGHHKDDILAGKKITVCPCLSVNKPLADDMISQNFDRPRDIDVILCGYAYASRKKFVSQWLANGITHGLLLIGDGWDAIKVPNVTTLPTQSEAKTMEYYCRAKIIVCVHRDKDDLGHTSVFPRSVHRGYLEAYFGALVLIDSSREQHSFRIGDAVFFNGIPDLKKKIQLFLNDETLRTSIAARGQERAQQYSFQARMTAALNHVRSQRFLGVVP